MEPDQTDTAIGLFDHKGAPAYRWPADTLVEELTSAGFVELERGRRQVADRPDRIYGTVVAVATKELQ